MYIYTLDNLFPCEYPGKCLGFSIPVGFLNTLLWRGEINGKNPSRRTGHQAAYSAGQYSGQQVGPGESMETQNDGPGGKVT